MKQRTSSRGSSRKTKTGQVADSTDVETNSSPMKPHAAIYQAEQLSSQAYMWLVLLALQFGLQPFLFSTFTPPDVIKSMTIIIQEGIKMFVCVMLMFADRRAAPCGWRRTIISGHYEDLYPEVFKSWSFRDSLKAAALPAFLYAIQNVCQLYAYMLLDGLTFNLLNQTKIIWGALFIYLIVGKRKTVVQYIALTILFSTAIMITTDPAALGAVGSSHLSTFGVCICLAAATLSGLAGSIVQYNLQHKKRDSLLLSAELGFYSAMFLIIRLALEYFIQPGFYVGDGHRLASGDQSLLTGVDWYLLIPLTANALGGIVVGQVVKHAGGVNKGYGLIGGVLLSALMRIYVDGIFLSGRLLSGMVFTIFAMWLNFSNQGTELNTYIENHLHRESNRFMSLKVRAKET